MPTLGIGGDIQATRLAGLSGPLAHHRPSTSQAGTMRSHDECKFPVYPWGDSQGEAVLGSHPAPAAHREHLAGWEEVRRSLFP
eukprot:scaffold72480_cov43-Prasinocladus_malaysianus.AAC.1